MTDPKDIVFYEVALSVEDSYLVTGNTKHFPKKPFVVTPSEMLQIINGMKSPKTGLLSEPSAKYGNR
jgi:predicted nucleic acid-binding protein